MQAAPLVRRWDAIAGRAAGGLIVACLLGACAGVPQGPETVAQDAAPSSPGRVERLVPAALKNAQAAVLAYNQSRKDESAAREAAQAARNAALVAWHRYSTGTGDYVSVARAEEEQAGAEDRLKAASAQALAARQGLVRALGLTSFSSLALPVSAPAHEMPPAGPLAPL
jgi:hypothetical protein